MRCFMASRCWGMGIPAISIFPAWGAEEADHHADGGGFAGAVDTDEAEGGAQGDLQGEIVDGGGVAEAAGDVLQADREFDGLAHG